MNLMLLEIDGIGCIADHQQRLAEAHMSKHSYKSGGYLRRLYDLTLLAEDKPVIGARELIDFLAEQKWRIVLLTQRIRTREVYHATTGWLKLHGFDDYSYDLVFKEPQYNFMSIAQWKATKAWWYTQETLSKYKSIVLIDPDQTLREQVGAQWNAFSDQPLLTYASLTEFGMHQLLYEKERNPLLAEKRQFLRRMARGDAVQQKTEMSARIRESRAEPVQYDTLGPGDALFRSVLPVAGEPTRSVEPSSLPMAHTREDVGESAHEQDRRASELQKEVSQPVVAACIVEEVTHDEPHDDEDVQHPLFFEDVVPASYDDDGDTVPLEMETDESEDEEEHQYEPVSTRKRAVKGHHMDIAHDEQDENSGKKQTKKKQRERQSVRLLKEAVLSYGSDE